MTSINKSSYKLSSNTYECNLYKNLDKINIPEVIINIIINYTQFAGKLKHTLLTHTSSIECLVVLKNGDLVSGSRDYTIKKYSDNKLVQTLIGHNGAVWCLVVLHNGDIASGSTDSTI